VALISGQATLDSALDALNTGAFAYLLKPVNADKIRDVIDRGLRKVEDARTRQKLEQQVAQLTELEQSLKTLQDQVARPVGSNGLAELIDGLHHELGNVTQAIRLNLETLEEAGKVPPELRENMKDLHASSEDLVQLVNRLKDYPALTKRGEGCDVRLVVAGALAALQLQAAAKRVTLLDSAPDTELPVACEPDSLQRAFRQVVQNAIEAVPDGGQVRVSVTSTSGHAVITVEDNGPGIREDLLDRLFKPDSTTRITDGFVRGLGMGLFTARAAVELHGGDIRAANRPEGGASVIIRLPLRPA
jgi:signal transduction histidine kinase